jgi:hypothetical protein
MDAVVRRNPSDTCRVSAVPTAWGGTLSVTSTLNCAESAMMKKPQTRAIGARIQSDRPKAKPSNAQHVPLISIARMTRGARPTRSATSPPHMQPRPPTAITPNDRTATAVEAEGVSACGSRAALAATNAGIQVQYE